MARPKKIKSDFRTVSVSHAGAVTDALDRIRKLAAGLFQFTHGTAASQKPASASTEWLTCTAPNSRESRVGQAGERIRSDAHAYRRLYFAVHESRAR